MKKVLIISYYWPPAGGPGVQRVLKFVKYLPLFGWEPIVLTVKSGSYPSIDKTLENDVASTVKIEKANIWEPDNVYKKFTGMSSSDSIPTAVLSEKSHGWKKLFAAWVRLNIFVPDAKMGWIPFAVYSGNKIIKKEKPDLIFSTSPPPSAHLIAKKLQKKSGLKWVADFRDPWTEIHYYEDKNRTRFSKNRDKNMESSVLNKADKIICISKRDIEQDFGKKTDIEKCINIANGYDETDFADIDFSKTDTSKFILLHLGAVGAERVPKNLFKAIKTLSDKKVITKESFQLQFIGKVEVSLEDSIKQQGVEEFVSYLPYMPHKEALEKAARASAMLLLITQSKKNVRILPGKTFEYMRMQKPILGLGPDNGEVAQILTETGAGNVIDYNNYEQILEKLRLLIESPSQPISLQSKVKDYDRKNLTGKLAGIFDNLV